MKNRSEDGEKEFKKRRGRPKKEGGGNKNFRIELRVSEDEYDNFKNASKVSGKTVSDLFRVGGLRFALEETMKREDNGPDSGEKSRWEADDDDEDL